MGVSLTSYICTSCLRNINENKQPLYQVLNNFFRNKIIPLIQKLSQLEECFISPRLVLLKFINSKGMGNIRCMVVLLMSLQMWIKLNQYYHIYHMMVQQYVCFLKDVLNTNHLICSEMFIQIQ